MAKTFKKFLSESIGDTTQIGMFPGAENADPNQGDLLQDMHDDEADDAALIRAMVKSDCLTNESDDEHEIEIDYDEDEEI